MNKFVLFVLKMNHHWLIKVLNVEETFIPATPLTITSGSTVVGELEVKLAQKACKSQFTSEEQDYDYEPLFRRLCRTDVHIMYYSKSI